jgi:hypothetical protein
VNSLLAEFKLHTNKNCLLPKCCTLVLRFTHEGIDYNQVETGYAQQEEGHIKPRTSYVKTNKAAAQAKIGYAHKNQGYTAEVSTSRPSLY